MDMKISLSVPYPLTAVITASNFQHPLRKYCKNWNQAFSASNFYNLRQNQKQLKQYPENIIKKNKKKHDNLNHLQTWKSQIRHEAKRVEKKRVRNVV
jgi:site-specific recombinase